MNYLITSDFLVEFRSNILYGVDYLRFTCIFLSIGVFHGTSGFGFWVWGYFRVGFFGYYSTLF